MWHVEIVEGPMSGSPAYADDLATTLNRLQVEGWKIFAVLVNGINRWTVVAQQ